MLGQERGGRRCDLPKWHSLCVVAGYSIRSREGTQVGDFQLLPALHVQFLILTSLLPSGLQPLHFFTQFTVSLAAERRLPVQHGSARIPVEGASR